jgi:uncharacterized protein (TIGR01777 family)
MQTILITGGTGMIGQALTNTLIQKGYHVIILTRSPKRSSRLGLSYALWDIEKKYIDTDALAAADCIVHLAGESVATKRWTAKRKQEILDSRTSSSSLIVEALSKNPHKIKTIISASAIGWYGPDTVQSLQDGFKESDPVDPSFLGSTCQLWEEGMHPVTTQNIRLVTLRIGIVLNKRGGALAEFIKPAKLGVAAILGNGKQIVSWIHQQDLCDLILYSIENDKINGVYNAVAPHPVTNKDLTLAVASKLHKYYLPVNVPSFVLKIMLGEMSIEVLKSARVSSEKIQKAGFIFGYPTLQEAITQLL